MSSPKPTWHRFNQRKPETGSIILVRSDFGGLLAMRWNPADPNVDYDGYLWYGPINESPTHLLAPGDDGIPKASPPSRSSLSGAIGQEPGARA